MVIKRRIEWIDILRCIAMFLVVIGHASKDSDPNSLRFYIYSFHLPLFFIIAGAAFYLQTKNKFFTIKEMIVNKINGLIIPYFILSFLSLLIWILNFKILSYRDTSILKEIVAIFYSNPGQFAGPSNALWFLPTLFLTTITFLVIVKWAKEDDRLLTLMILAISSIGYTMSLRADKFLLPWRVDTVLVAIFFFLIGYLFIKHYEKIKALLGTYKRQIIMCLIIFPIAFCFARYNVKISMAYTTYGSFLHFVIAALGFSSITTIIAMNLPNFRVMSFIGRNTLVYLAFHAPIFRFLEVYSEASRLYFENHPIMVGILVFIALIPVAYVFEKYLPFLIGRKKFIKE